MTSLMGALVIVRRPPGEGCSETVSCPDVLRLIDATSNAGVCACVVASAATPSSTASALVMATGTRPDAGRGRRRARRRGLLAPRDAARARVRAAPAADPAIAPT